MTHHHHGSRPLCRHPFVPTNPAPVNLLLRTPFRREIEGYASCPTLSSRPYHDSLLDEPLTFFHQSGRLTAEVNLDRVALAEAIRAGRVEWQRHAFERMVERGIARAEVQAALLHGDLIEDYPDDRPFPSALFFRMSDRTPVHVVTAWDAHSRTVFVITAYRPDADHFEADWKTRRGP